MTDYYAQRDHRALGEHYLRHVSAMTAEGLHAKSDIAAELAWRDAEIERLRARVAELVDALDELLGPYTGGAESTLHDDYIVERAIAVRDRASAEKEGT